MSSDSQLTRATYPSRLQQVIETCICAGSLIIERAGFVLINHGGVTVLSGKQTAQGWSVVFSVCGELRHLVIE